jgi:hypothetical protein
MGKSAKFGQQRRSKMSNPDLGKMLADEIAKQAAMTEEERRKYLDQIAHMKAHPYTEGERQAQAMMPIEIKNMRGPSPCPKCGAAPEIEKHPPSFGDDGSVVFSCCAITSVADDITGAQAHWDGAVVGYRAGVEDAARAIEAEVARGRSFTFSDNARHFIRIVRALLNSEADAALQTKGDA